jgi:hypothetical protein
MVTLPRGVSRACSCLRHVIRSRDRR